MCGYSQTDITWSGCIVRMSRKCSSLFSDRINDSIRSNANDSTIFTNGIIHDILMMV